MRVQCFCLLVVGCKTLPEKKLCCRFQPLGLWSFFSAFFLKSSDLGQVGAK